MNKFFGIEKRPKKKTSEENEVNIQGYIAPSNNRFINSQGTSDETETFVYQSVPNSPNVNNNVNSGVVNNNIPPYGVNVSNNVQVPEVLDMPTLEEESKINNLNPLNNANNPIPVNPIAESVKEVDIEEVSPNVKANIFSVIGMMFGMLLTPGTTIVKNAKKYRSFNKACFITIWITVVTLVLCLGVRILLGSFYRTYNGVTGAYTINFNISNIFSLDNYIIYLVIAFLVSGVSILVVSLVYYASSFVNSKGVPFASYLMVSNLALLPFIIGVVVLYPAANIISGYLGLLVLIFTFFYTLVSFMVGINEILTFKNINRKILYNVLNLTFVILVIFLISVFLIRMNILPMPEISV